MIKLSRGPKPSELTAQLQTDLTTEFKSSGKSVWNIDWLKESLSNFSAKKCAYCECFINEEAKYLEVEHFKDKVRNPDLVMEWTNLLPSCKRCNANKRDHDVTAEPIIDPTVDNPQSNVGFREYRLRQKSGLGEKTIEVLSLNDSDRLVKMRYQVGEAIHKALEKIKDICDTYPSSPTTAKRNKICTQTKQLLAEANPNSKYAATAATVLLDDPIYDVIKTDMVTFGFWDQECQDLENGAASIKLDRL